MTIAIVTDSSTYLTREQIEKYGIRIVPLHVLIDGRDRREGVDDLGGVFDKGVEVTTSAATPAELSAAYTEALAADGVDSVLAVHLSRHLSRTWESASLAAKPLGGKVRVVDSQTAGMGVGFAVLAAARTARAGGSLDEAYEVAVDAARRTLSLFYVDRLDYLRRGGRMGTVASLLGTALAMKPVLHVLDGRVTLREKTRTASKALAKLIESVVDAAGDAPTALAVQHINASGRAEHVANELTERIPNITEIHTSQLGAVLGVHLGPGTVGIAACIGGAGTID